MTVDIICVEILRSLLRPLYVILCSSPELTSAYLLLTKPPYAIDLASVRSRLMRGAGTLKHVTPSFFVNCHALSPNKTHWHHGLSVPPYVRHSYARVLLPLNDASSN